MSLDRRSAAIVVEAARRGSLGRAARALNMTQPAATRLLKRLEAAYGVPLFERTTRGVAPTPYGAAILPHAERVLSEAAAADEAIRRLQGASRGVVRVGGVGSVVGGLIVPAVTAMRREHPQVQFRVVEELEDTLLDALQSGRIDFAISPDPLADEGIALAIPQALEDRVGVFARPAHPLASAPLTLAAAAGAAWALPPPGTPVHRDWLRRFLAAGLEPAPPALASRSAAALIGAALADDLLLWMPGPLVAADLARGALLPLPCPPLEARRAFRIWRRRRGVLAPPSAPFLRHLAAAAT